MRRPNRLRVATSPGIAVEFLKASRSGQQPQTNYGRRSRSPTPSPDLGLPTADEFLIMHKFRPWSTKDYSNMVALIRRLLSLMPHLQHA